MKKTSRKQSLWFRRKLYGWGWTPINWQGWVVTLLYCVLLFGLSTTIEKNAENNEAPIIFLIGVAILTIILLVVAYKKGEKPRWQWGRDLDK